MQMLVVSETWTKLKEDARSCQLTDFISGGGGAGVGGKSASVDMRKENGDTETVIKEKHKHGVWDPMQELTITLLISQSTP
jgi:hypothetical protein